MEKLYTSKTFLKMADGGCIALILPPGSAPGHELQKPSKESGIFLSRGTINFVFFTKRWSRKGGGGHGPIPPLNTLLRQAVIVL